MAVVGISGSLRRGLVALQISNVGALFDENGLRDEETRTRLTRFVPEFASVARR